MYRTLFLATTLSLLAGCASTALEDDMRYIKLVKVVDVHVFSDEERKEARKTAPRRNSGFGLGIGLGYGTGGGFGGVMLGATTPIGSGRDTTLPPQAADGADRYTVQPLDTQERIEVMSYGKYKIGDCVKLYSGHPTRFARLFDLKPGESCAKLP